MGKYFLPAVFSFLSFFAYSQHELDPATWKHIDTSVRRNKDLSDISELVQQLKQKALAEKKYFQVARAYHYQVLINDRRSEDSLYFRNSAIYDSLLMTNSANPELQAAIHLLQAQRLTGFVSKYVSYRRQRYEQRYIPVNYAKFDDVQLDSIANYHYTQAKKIASQLTAAHESEFLWMAYDPLIFLFKPVLFDIVIANQISNTTKRYYFPALSVNQYSKYISASQDEFISHLDSLYQIDRFRYPFMLYKEWLEFHHQSQATYYFIETLVRKFFYDIHRGYNAESKKSEMYKSYLFKLTSSPYNMARAHAVYQLCMLWASQAKNYFPGQSGNYSYSRYDYGYSSNDKEYDTAYRYHAVKALRLFDQHKNVLDSFAYLRRSLERLEETIRRPELHISLDQYNLPGEPMLAELDFKNATRLYCRVIRKNVGFTFNYKIKDELLRTYLQLPVAREQEIDLPFTDDHNTHALYFKLDPLPTGLYVLLFSHKPIVEGNEDVEDVNFRVSNIAVVSNDEHLFVLDRKTGMPLGGAEVLGEYDTTLNRKWYKTDEKGYCRIDDIKINGLDIYYKGDSIYKSIRLYEKNYSYDDDDIYDKEEYEDLVEFYEDNAEAHIFTDRAIYRPGQTVHFKAVFTTKHRKTGETMIMSKKNMKGSLFGNVYKKWLKESEPALYLMDAMNREIDTINIKLSDYGTVYGSFKLPKTAITGDWSIEPDYIDVSSNEGVFKVEEYKRPSYEISFEKPKKEILPGDSFRVKVKLRSFAGAMLNNVQVGYTVSRHGQLPDDENTQAKYIDVDLVDTVGFTNDEGELDILITDSMLRSYKLADSVAWSFRYNINVDAMDATGESYEESESVIVTSRPVNIRMPTAAKYERNAVNKILLSTEVENMGRVSKEVRLQVSRHLPVTTQYGERRLVKADHWLYNKNELQQLFPRINITGQNLKPDLVLVLDTTINTGTGSRFTLDPQRFSAGIYTIVATVTEDGRTKGRTKKEIQVFDQKENKLPGVEHFAWMPFNSLRPGDTLKYYSGHPEATIYSIYQWTYYTGKKKKQEHNSFEYNIQHPGILRRVWKLPTDARGMAYLSQVFVLNNQVFTTQTSIYVEEEQKAEPEIIVEQYRQKLSPGTKETFSVSIKTKDINTAAELMTTLYDASLDKLENHEWNLPRFDRENYRGIDRHDWERNINFTARNYNYSNESRYKPSRDNSWETPLWWINPRDFGNEDVMADWSSVPGFQHDLNPNARWDATASLSGKVSGLTVDEVVVVGYGTAKKMSLSGSAVTIRGYSSLSSSIQPLIILDGLPFTGDLSKLDPNVITQGLILKGADATAIYGAAAASGVLILSTNGDVILPGRMPEPQVVPRKNFNETAFFFPAIHADRKGYYIINFTMPESVTEWNWKMMAHTREGQFIYSKRKLTTQLPLMVQPNIPRLLYQGDRIILQSRISNLDSVDANGQMECKIEDVVTGEDITNALVTTRQKEFSVAKRANIASSFEVRVPKTQLNPLRVTITARSQNFADGEEHVIPVLSPRLLVRKDIAFRFQKNKDTTIQAPPLPSSADMYGVAVSILPKPQTSLINALPYLANFPIECAEQVFNKMLAQLTAIRIMRTDKAAAQAFERARLVLDKQPDQKEQLPDELSEQTMPWLNLGNMHSKQQKQLYQLLDTSDKIKTVSALLEKLYKMQNTDGGITWFKGGPSNSYISHYLLAGFGKLNKNEIYLPARLIDDKYKKFIQKLVEYCDNGFNTEVVGTYGFDSLHYSYARSFWFDAYPMHDSSKGTIRKMLNRELATMNKLILYRQAALITAVSRYFNVSSSEYQKAAQQLRSIRQLAIHDEANGMRWKEVADMEDLSFAAEETVAMIAQAFSELKQDASVQTEVVKWLLSAKQDNYWTSTKATSAVIEMLMKEKSTATGSTQSIVAKTGNSSLKITDDLLSGSDFAFAKQNGAINIELEKQNAEPAQGHLIYYYFSSADSIDKLNDEMRLRKEISRYNSSSKQWEKVNGSMVLHIGDKLSVTLSIETPRALKYVYIDDKRSAAFEPGAVHSGYGRTGHLSYYESVRDADTQFFCDYIPAGISTISYEMIVSQEGSFVNGPSALQCMYRPEVAVYSNSIKVEVVK